MPAGAVPPTVLVASDDLTLLDDIVRHLEDIPTWKLITSPGSAAQFVSAFEANSPDAVVLSDVLATELAGQPLSFGPASIVVVARQEHNATLKAALRLGARGFVLWPGEARLLQGLVERDGAAHSSQPAASGAVYAVWSPKGGSGASVVSAHLAGCMAAAPDGCMLVDADLDHGDQSSILGVTEGTKNLSDLLRMGDELSTHIVDSVAWAHPDGFKAVLSPGISGESALVKGPELSRVLSSIRGAAGNIVVDVPSGLNEIASAVIHEAGLTVVVVTPDLLCLKRARDGLRALRSSGVDDSRLVLLVNQTSSSAVSRRDVAAILGLEPAAEVRADLRMYHSANRGELSGAGKKMLFPLARMLVKEASGASRRQGRRERRRPA